MLPTRVGKTDSTGTYSYFCDGASAGSPVLNDGHATYTPGLSESRGGVSTYSAYDVLGNLWFVDNASAQQTFYQDTTAFGSGAGLGIGGTEAGPFKFGGGNGCQVEADTGYVLMGHRYYDPRIGRFISQDPAKSGTNWYSYAGNNPVNKTDPTGLTPMDGPGSSPEGSPGYNNIGGGGLDRGEYEQNFDSFLKEAESRQDFYAAPLKPPAVYAELDPIVSGGYGFSVSMFKKHYTVSLGIALDILSGDYEGFGTIGDYQGFGYGASGSPFVSEGLGDLSGYNGGSSGYNFVAGPHGGLGYDYNSGYHGVTVNLPISGMSPGFEAGAYQGGQSGVKGGSYTWPLFSGNSGSLWQHISTALSGIINF